MLLAFLGTCLADVQSQDADPSRPSRHIFHLLFVNREGGDGMKVERLRKIFVKFEDTMIKNIGKWRKKHGDDIPNLVGHILYTHMLVFMRMCAHSRTCTHSHMHTCTHTHIHTHAQTQHSGPSSGHRSQINMIKIL